MQFKLILYLLFITFSYTQINAKDVGSNTGLKVPRFVTLKSDDVNLRVGSSTNYPLILKYTTKNLPLQVTEEYQYWRKIIDINGNVGWIHKNLLKGERHAIIKESEFLIKIYSKPNGKLIGEIGQFNIVKINICLPYWCKINYKNINGWIVKKKLWGVFENEKINIPFYQPVINQIWRLNLSNFLIFLK
tara:strand:+ start:3237 stop:3803 length:567 start_codon:yes stop_codon:yes gene_type:complete